MHFVMLVLSILALSDHWLLSLSEGSFLASARSLELATAGLATTVASREHLRAEATQLAGTLRSSLGVRAEVTAQHIARARELIGEEAERLALEGVPGARLMREYALRAPSVVLLMPPSEPAAFEEPGDLAAFPGDVEAVEAVEPFRQRTTESEESVLSNDGDGRIVTRTRHCTNGHCTQRTELTSASPKSSGHRTHARVFAVSRSTAAASQERLVNRIRRMSNEMWGVEQSVGHNRLQGVLQDIFAERGMQPVVDADT